MHINMHSRIVEIIYDVNVMRAKKIWTNIYLPWHVLFYISFFLATTIRFKYISQSMQYIIKITIIHCVYTYMRIIIIIIAE